MTPLATMYVFIFLFRAVCTLVLLVHKKRNAIAPKENSGLYQESVQRLLMVTHCLSLDLQWALTRDGGQEWCRVDRELSPPTNVVRVRFRFPAIHMWFVFVVLLSLCLEGFSPGFRFSSLHKNLGQKTNKKFSKYEFH